MNTPDAFGAAACPPPGVKHAAHSVQSGSPSDVLCDAQGGILSASSGLLSRLEIVLKLAERNFNLIISVLTIFLHP